jgi:hypothetical protein
MSRLDILRLEQVIPQSGARWILLSVKVLSTMRQLLTPLKLRALFDFIVLLCSLFISLIPRFSEVIHRHRRTNRFSGFHLCRKTAQAVAIA